MQTIRTPGVTLRLAEDVVPTTTTVVKDMQILKTGRFFDPRYKWFEVTEKMLSEMIANFKAGIRGIIPALDYAHDSEGKAAGWIKDLFVKEGERGQKELWGKVEVTPTAQKQLADKEWGYISSDFDDNYIDNETGKKHGAVLKGAALTNRPVIKGMDAVIQLSESSDAVSEKIKKLIDEGKSQDQAVAIALEMERQNKLSETEGDTMDQKEMEKKLADMETKCSEAEKKLGEMDAVLKAAGVADLEGLMKWIADQKAKGAPAPEMEVELADTKKMLAEANTKLAEASKKAQTAEKEVEFSKLLSEGKAVAAQREAFIAGDMAKFIELSQPIKLSEEGHGGGSKGGADDVEGEILKEAKKLSEEKSIPMNKAISQVLQSNKELAEKRQKTLN